MPIKSLSQRAKKARREGVSPAIRDTDLGGPAKSRHAARKAAGAGKASKRQADDPGSERETRARERMAGTRLRALKIGSERTTEILF